MSMPKTPELAHCDFCNEKFKPSKYWQRFCSNKCKNDWHKKQSRLMKELWEKTYGTA